MIRNFVWATVLLLYTIAPAMLQAQNHYDSAPIDGQFYEEAAPGQSDYFYDEYSAPYADRIPTTAVGNVRDRWRTRLQDRRARRQFQNESFAAEFPSYGNATSGEFNWGPVYLSLFAGVGFVDNLDSRSTFANGIPGSLGILETGFQTLDGVSTGGSIGRYFFRQARVEFEYTFRENGVGDMTSFIFSDDLATPEINDTLVSSTSVSADGNIESNSFMWNVLFDLQPRTVGRLNGYLGGGIGLLLVDSDIDTATASFNISDGAFAFQGIAGINFPFRERIDVFTEYRYLGADTISVTQTDIAGTTDDLGAFRFDSHSLVFGLRFLR